jgi:hypothetical protein
LGKEGGVAQSPFSSWRILPGQWKAPSIASVHVLDHALAQRADRIRTHWQLLSWMRLTTPRSSRQDARPAIDDRYPWSPYSQTNRPPQRAIAQRFSTLARHVSWCGAALCPELNEERKYLTHSRNDARGSSPTGYSAKPLVSFRINRQLSGWNLPPLMFRAFGAHCQMQTSRFF